MGKIILIIILVAVFKCNGSLLDVGGIMPVAQRQLNGALGLASSIFGGITSGIGLNLGQGHNMHKRPEHTNNQYGNTQNNPEYMGSGGDYYAPQYHQPQPPSHPPHNHHNSHRPHPTYNRPGEYGNQGHYHGYPNNGYNPSYNQNVPGHHSQHNGGNFNNNQYYGNQYPNNQNYGNNPGYNQGANNERPGQERPTQEGSQSYNKPDYGNNNHNDYSQQELLNDIFGSPQNPNNGLNSTVQSPNNTVTENPKEDLPTFVPISPVDTKRETETMKPPGGDEDFDIDIRFKGQ